MYAINDKHELFFVGTDEVCTDILPGSTQDIKIRYFLKFKKELEDISQYKNAVVEHGSKKPETFGARLDSDNGIFVSSDGKSCHDAELLSSYVKIMIRRRGLLLKPHFDMGFREKFTNYDTLKVIHDYFNAAEEEKAKPGKFRLLYRREMIAKHYNESRNIREWLYQPAASETLNNYQRQVKAMHDGLPPIFDRVGRKEFYAERVVATCGVDGDPKKIKLPLTGSTKAYTIYFPSIAKQRHIEIIKNSICFHSFPSAIDREVMKANIVLSVTDEIMWDEGEVLANYYIRKNFDKLHLSIAAIIAMCCSLENGKIITLSPYSQMETGQIMWRGTRYNRLKALYADIVLANNWKNYMDSGFDAIAKAVINHRVYTMSDFKTIELPECKSQILRVNEDKYLLNLQDGEELPLEELDLIQNIPTTKVVEPMFLKGKQEGRIILNKTGMEYVLKKYKVGEWKI
jgi:hypothetical protein